MKFLGCFAVAFALLFLPFLLVSCGGPTMTSTPTPTPTPPVHNLTQNRFYATIQGAIEDAQDGDKIVVSPGTYFERINFLGKNIVVRSEDPQNPSVVASTIIDGGGSGSVVTFLNGETRDATLQGLTIQHGGGVARKAIFLTTSGGGILIENASPTITANVIRDNSATIGGGIAIGGASSPWIVGNTVQGNIARSFGGGISVMGTASPVIAENSFNTNQAQNSGGGIFVAQLANVKDLSDTLWSRASCPPSGDQNTPGNWTYHNNLFSNNTHENGSTSDGCHVYFAF